MSMQMDVYLKKEQIGTLFVRVGAPEGGVRVVGGGSGGSSPKIIQGKQLFFLAPPACTPFFLDV